MNYFIGVDEKQIDQEIANCKSLIQKDIRSSDSAATAEESKPDKESKR